MFFYSSIRNFWHTLVKNESFSKKIIFEIWNGHKYIWKHFWWEIVTGFWFSYIGNPLVLVRKKCANPGDPLLLTPLMDSLLSSYALPQSTNIHTYIHKYMSILLLDQQSVSYCKLHLKIYLLLYLLPIYKWWFRYYVILWLLPYIQNWMPGPKYF